MRSASRLRALVTTAAALLATLLAVSGCNASSRSAGPDEPSASAAAGFPVTIKHAFGETTIDAPPQRIVTWGWGATDAVIALGQVPVGMPKTNYGGDAGGVLPWIREALEAKGAALPTLLDEGESVPLEQVAALKPDLLLAPYSGLTDADYKRLTGLGVDVVAFPSKPWSTPWPEVIITVGKALGQSAKAEEVLGAIDVRIAEAAAAHPEFTGKTVAQVWDDGGKNFYVYLPADPRVTFSEDLGLVSAPSVTALDTKEASFYYTLSTEKLDELTSDVLVVYADTQDQVDEFLGSKRAQLLPQVKAGTVAAVIGQAQVSAVSPPTALSLTWGIDAYVDSLAKAVAKLG